eukprot:gene10159-2579_t
MKQFSVEEVSKHTSENDCWVIVNGKVLNVTKFLDEHPGGKDSIMMFAGKDASEEFNMIHAEGTIEKTAPFTIIGTVGASSTVEKKQEEKQEKKIETFASGVTNDFSKPNNTLSLDPIAPVVPSTVESKNSGGTMGILDKERETSTFDVKKMIDFMNGGAEMTKKKRFILGPSSKMNFDHKHDLSRSDFLAAHVKHFYDVHKNFFGKYIPSRDEVMFMAENSILSGSLGNHHGLFLPTVLGMANDEQRNWWLPRILTLRMIGCYCQTELGHGSNVRGLRTTATYDKATEEFILDTPTLQATKWWPGALGKVCTHAALYAQLIIDGKEYGVHVFMLQIRDENHRPFKGIEVGDLGPKLGDGANDTGFLRLHNVRIPREMMFGRHSHVSKEGKYVKAAKKGQEDDSKLHYATMMFTRGTMVRQAGAYLAQACTIATRYNCIRKQGFTDTSQKVSYKTEEFKLMDYQIQQHRIFKQIAWAYAMKFIGTWLIDNFKKLSGEGSQDNYVITNLDELPEIASTTAGFKAVATSLCGDGIEDLRKACGGNGYLLSSGIAGLTADWVWRITAEGDWIILMLQAARFIVKTIQKSKKGIKSHGPYEYLNSLGDKNFKYSNYKPNDIVKVENFFDLGYLERLFKYYSLCIVGSVGIYVADKAEKVGNFDSAARENQVELINAVKVHSYYFTIVRYRYIIDTIQDSKMKAVLTRLACLLACTVLTEHQWADVITLKELKLARNAISVLLKELRPDAVALVDSFDIPDRVLCSAIGKSDGNIYEELFEAAKRSEINQQDPFKGYDYMSKYLDKKFLAKGNNVPKSRL